MLDSLVNYLHDVFVAQLNGWMVLGFVAQALFTMRFVVQWIASERARRSVIPVAFWFFSIGGGALLLTYAIYRRDAVFIAGQAFSLLIYFRNLYFIMIRGSQVSGEKVSGEKVSGEKASGKKTRPTSVSVIAWILIALGVSGALWGIFVLSDPATTALMEKGAVSIPVQFAILYVGWAVTLAAAVAMLFGKNWGRLLYVGWSVLGLVIGALISPMKLMLIPAALVPAILAFFLFRPKANAYFSGESADRQIVQTF